MAVAFRENGKGKMLVLATGIQQFKGEGVFRNSNVLFEQKGLNYGTEGAEQVVAKAVGLKIPVAIVGSNEKCEYNDKKGNGHEMVVGGSQPGTVVKESILQAGHSEIGHTKVAGFTLVKPVRDEKHDLDLFSNGELASLLGDGVGTILLIGGHLTGDVLKIAQDATANGFQVVMSLETSFTKPGAQIAEMLGKFAALSGVKVEETAQALIEKMVQ